MKVAQQVWLTPKVGEVKKKGLVTACNFCIKYLSSTKLETIIHKYIKFRHKIIKYFFKSK